jgi:hypothetical protein
MRSWDQTPARGSLLEAVDNMCEALSVEAASAADMAMISSTTTTARSLKAHVFTSRLLAIVSVDNIS